MIQAKTEALAALCSLYEIANGVVHKHVVFETFAEAIGKDASNLDNLLEFLESRNLVILDYDGTNEVQFVLLSDTGGPEAERFMSENEFEDEPARGRINSADGIDVFISHGSQDKPLASALIRLIERSLGIESDRIRCTSVPGYGLDSGTLTETALREEIIGTCVFIGLLTPSSIGSSYVLFELGARWGADLRLIPLLARGAGYDSLPGPLRGRTAIFANKRADILGMLQSLSDELESPLTRADVYDSDVATLMEEAVIESVAPSLIDSPADSVQRFGMDQDACSLLLEAIVDSRGSLMRTRSKSGLSIQTNRKQFTEMGDPRSEARWERAFETLIELDLIKDLGSGSVYRVTDKGYRVGDTIKETESQEQLSA